PPRSPSCPFSGGDAAGFVAGESSPWRSSHITQDALSLCQWHEARWWKNPSVAPTTYGLDAHGGHRFESSPLSFLLSTPPLFSPSFPVPLFTALKSPKYIFKKKKKV